MALFCEAWVESDDVEQAEVRDGHGDEEAEVDDREGYAECNALRDARIFGRVEEVFHCNELVDGLQTVFVVMCIPHSSLTKTQLAYC